MQCSICKRGTTERGTATLTLERAAMTLVVKHVPADVCSTCGEEYVDEAVTATLLAQAEAAASRGVTVEVREYSAA